MSKNQAIKEPWYKSCAVTVKRMLPLPKMMNPDFDFYIDEFGITRYYKKKEVEK